MEQLMGNGIGVHTGQSAAEKHFQHFMVVKPIGAHLVIALAHPFSVAVVYTHSVRSPLFFIHISIVTGRPVFGKALECRKKDGRPARLFYLEWE